MQSHNGRDKTKLDFSNSAICGNSKTKWRSFSITGPKTRKKKSFFGKMCYNSMFGTYISGDNEYTDLFFDNESV